MCPEDGGILFKNGKPLRHQHVQPVVVLRCWAGYSIFVGNVEQNNVFSQTFVDGG